MVTMWTPTNTGSNDTWTRGTVARLTRTHTTVLICSAHRWKRALSFEFMLIYASIILLSLSLQFDFRRSSSFFRFLYDSGLFQLLLFVVCLLSIFQCMRACRLSAVRAAYLAWPVSSLANPTLSGMQTPDIVDLIVITNRC